MEIHTQGNLFWGQAEYLCSCILLIILLSNHLIKYNIWESTFKYIKITASLKGDMYVLLLGWLETVFARGNSCRSIKRLTRVLRPGNGWMLQWEDEEKRGGRQIWHLFSSNAGATIKVKGKTGCVWSGAKRCVWKGRMCQCDGRWVRKQWSE